MPRNQPQLLASEAWLGALRQDGFVVAPSMLDSDALAELRMAFPPPTPGSTLHVEIDVDTPFAHRWRSLDQHPEVARMLRDALGDPVVRIHGRDPGRGAGAQGLHADCLPGRHRRIETITLIWMLDDFTAENGATRVVPRSHRGATAVPRHLAVPGITHPDEVIVTGRAGDVLVFDGHLWHAGRRNTVGSRRRSVQMTVVSGASESLTNSGSTTSGTRPARRASNQA